MRQTVTLSLPEWILKKLDQLTRREEVSRSEIVRHALKQYLVQQDFQKIRGEITHQAERRGIFTEEDIFKKVS